MLHRSCYLESTLQLYVRLFLHSKSSFSHYENYAWQKLDKTNLKLGMILLPQSRKLKTMSLRLKKITSMQLQWVSAILYYIIFRCCLQLKICPEVINLACKLLWMEEHWSEEDVKNAKEWTIKMVKWPLIHSKFPSLTSVMLLQMLDHLTTHHHTTTPFQRTHLSGDLNQQPASATTSHSLRHEKTMCTWASRCCTQDSFTFQYVIFNSCTIC